LAAKVFEFFQLVINQKRGRRNQSIYRRSPLQVYTVQKLTCGKVL